MLNLFDTHVLLGKVKGSGAPVWYPIRELTKHALFLAATGGGKTTLLYWIISQLLQGKVGCWMFDRKEDFRHLIRLFPDKLLVFNLAEDFRCNPLEPPPYTKPMKWLEIFVDLYCRTNNLLDGSKSMLLITMKDLYERHKVNSESNDYPSFFELLEALKILKLTGRSRSSNYKDSLVNRLEAYLATNEQLYDCSVGFDIEALLTKSVVFELGGLIDFQANFWINLLLYWMFAYRIGKKERGNRLLNLVVFDEAKSVFPPFENPALGFPPITYMISMLREFGVGIIASDQMAQLSNAIFANSQLKVLWRLGSGDDLLKVARAMGLSAEQAAYTHTLGLGEAIVSLPKVGTFVLQIPEFPLE